jgi:hypothetical protein
MPDGIIFLVALLAELGIARLLFRTLFAKFSQGKIRLRTVNFLYCLPMTVIPYIFVNLAVVLSAYLYNHYPVFQEPAWDDNLMVGSFFALIFGFGISAICIWLACSEFIALGRANQSKHET